MFTTIAYIDDYSNGHFIFYYELLSFYSKHNSLTNRIFLQILL